MAVAVETKKLPDPSSLLIFVLNLMAEMGAKLGLSEANVAHWLRSMRTLYR